MRIYLRPLIANKIKNIYSSVKQKAFYRTFFLLFPYARITSEILETKFFRRDIQPCIFNQFNFKKIIVLAPHPDDELFGCGGTLKKFLEYGSNIHVIYFTSGSENQNIAQKIENEAERLCESWGMNPIFLRQNPKQIELHDKLIDKLCSCISSMDPDIIFTTFFIDDHDDHKKICESLLKIKKRNIKLPQIWSYQIYTTIMPNLVVDITDQIAIKLDWVRKYNSVSGNRDWATFVQGMAAINSRYIPSKNPVFVEAFLRLNPEDYILLIERFFSSSPRIIYTSDCYKNAA